MSVPNRAMKMTMNPNRLDSMNIPRPFGTPMPRNSRHTGRRVPQEPKISRPRNFFSRSTTARKSTSRKA